MTDAATYFEDLMGLLPAVTPDTIVSRSVYSGDDARVTLFGFAPGQELTEHTAARPALLHFLRGRARLVLGGKAAEAGPGTWVRLPAHMPHSIFAEDEVVMLLTLLG